MPWIRLSDDYVDDEKMQALSDKAFRLWHEGIAYCRRHKTDGIIPFTVLRNLRSFTSGAEKQLAAPVREGVAPLWKLIPATGYMVHNYLKWNLSKEEERDERSATAARVRKFREVKRECNTVTPSVTGDVTNGDVPVRIGKEEDLVREKGSGGKPIEARSGRPIFKGQRLVIFEWMLEDCLQTLGEHANSFDLHEWFFVLDVLAAKQGLVIPKRDGGAWLQAQLVAEAQKRGIPLKMATAIPAKDHEAEDKAQKERVKALLQKDGIVA